MRALTSLLFPIHPEGYKFIGVFAALTLLLYFISDFLGNAGLVLTLWCAGFSAIRRARPHSATALSSVLPMA